MCTPAAPRVVPDPMERGSGRASSSDSAWASRWPLIQPSLSGFSSSGQVSHVSRRHDPPPDQCQMGSSSLTLGHSASQCCVTPSLHPIPSAFVTHILTSRVSTARLDILRDRRHSHIFITGYCCDCSVLLLVVNLFLCLIWKPNFIIGVCKYRGTANIEGLVLSAGSAVPWGSWNGSLGIRKRGCWFPIVRDVTWPVGGLGGGVLPVMSPFPVNTYTPSHIIFA